MYNVKQINKEKNIRNWLIASLFLIIIVCAIVFREDLWEHLYNSFFDKGNYKTLLKGLLNTLIISLCALGMGILLGTLNCLLQGSESQNSFLIILKQLSKFYVMIFRGTPVAVQLLIIYFVIFASFNGDALYIAILVFGLNSGAYVSEIIRGGIIAVPNGQMEGGRSLGLSYRQVMGNIIMPQAFKNALPSLGNEFISLIKETSVASFIGAVDLTAAFRKIVSKNYDYITVYLTMGISYFLIVLVFTQLLKKLEKKIVS